jgi:hypothetical protein
MKRVNTVLCSAILVAMQWGSVATAQQDPLAAVGKSPAQLMGLYVFGQKSQTAAVQSADELKCFESGKTASGYDQAMAGVGSPVQAPAKKGSVAGSTVGGAATGAVIGAVAGDAGKGAKIGATVGVLKGAGQNRRANAAQAQAQSANAAQEKKKADALVELKRAFSACMDARGYSVK